MYCRLQMDTYRLMGAKFPQERGGGVSKGELFMCINPNPLSKIVIVYEPSNLLLSVSKLQSLSTCKRVSVKSHFT
jgi:hypothetical protein